MTRTHCDIAVVGGGITGSAAACALLRAGFSVRLIERGKIAPSYQPASYDPRVYAISPGSAELMNSLELWDSVLATRAAPMQRMQVWDHTAAQALRFDAGDAGAETLGWIIEHSLLAQRLWQALPAESVVTATEVVSAQFGDEAATLQLSSGEEIQTELVIGAEGAESPLREAAGIQTTGWSYAATAVVCHVECEVPHHGIALQRFLPSGPVALLPLADGRRSLVWSTTDADAQALLKLDDAAFVRHLEDAMQSAAGRLSLPTRRLAFPLRLMHAEHYVASRCALVGDSAHLIHPLAGQGLNLGLADVSQLVAELSDARRAGRDWSALRILSRYERARQAENLDMLAITDVLGRAFALDMPGWRRLLHLGMRAVDGLPPLKQALAGRATGTV